MQFQKNFDNGTKGRLVFDRILHKRMQDLDWYALHISRLYVGILLCTYNPANICSSNLYSSTVQAMASPLEMHYYVQKLGGRAFGIWVKFYHFWAEYLCPPFFGRNNLFLSGVMYILRNFSHRQMPKSHFFSSQRKVTREIDRLDLYSCHLHKRN